MSRKMVKNIFKSAFEKTLDFLGKFLRLKSDKAESYFRLSLNTRSLNSQVSASTRGRKAKINQEC